MGEREGVDGRKRGGGDGGAGGEGMKGKGQVDERIGWGGVK